MRKKLESRGVSFPLPLSSDLVAKAFTANPIKRRFKFIYCLILAVVFASQASAQSNPVQDRSDAFNMVQRLGNGLAFGSNMWKYVEQGQANYQLDPDNFYDPIDFSLTREAGFNHIRINARLQNMQLPNQPGVLRNVAIIQLTSIIQDAIDHDLLVVICPFFWWSYEDTDDPRGAPVYGYEEQDHQNLANMWEQIAIACNDAGFPADQVVFELWEEPNGPGVDQMIALSVDAIEDAAVGYPSEIGDRYIVIPGDGFPTITGMERVFQNNWIPLDNPRLIGTFHFYEPKCLFANPGAGGNCTEGWDAWESWPSVANDEARLREWFEDLEIENSDWATENGTVELPIYMGEFGTRNKPDVVIPNSPEPDGSFPRDQRKHWNWWARMVAEDFGYSPVYWNSYGQNSFGLGNNDFDTPANRTLGDPNDPTDEAFIRHALLGRYQAEDPLSVSGQTLADFNSGAQNTSEGGFLSFQGITAASGSIMEFDDVYAGSTNSPTVVNAYNVTIRFSNLSSSDVNLDIRTEGPGGNTNSSLLNVPFAPTGGTIWYSKTLQLNLATGINKIQLIPTDVTGNLRIDYIAVTHVNKIYEDHIYSYTDADDRVAAFSGVGTFPVIADAHVFANAPDNNYGTSSTLAVRQTGNWARDAYLKFDVTDLNQQLDANTQIGSVKIMVYSETEIDAVNALSVSNAWSETGITWNNRPAAGAVVGSGQASPGQWFEIDVTGHVTGDGQYSFVLSEQGDTKHDLGSREGGNGAYLEVRLKEIIDVGIDAHVFANAPDSNYGTSSILAVRQMGQWAREAYLRFFVPELSAPVQSANLVVYSETEVDLVTASEVSANGWQETGITWNNRPAIGPVLGSAQASPGQWFEIDVSSFVTGSGNYTFALQEQGDTKHDLGSKEGGNGARLEIYY